MFVCNNQCWSTNEEEDSVEGVGSHTVSSSLDRVPYTGVSGDGGAGSIKQINFAGGKPYIHYAESNSNITGVTYPSSCSSVPNAPATTTKHPFCSSTTDIKLAFTGHAVLIRGCGRTDCSHKNRMRRIGEDGDGCHANRLQVHVQDGTRSLSLAIIILQLS
ncbi:hypothetical protein Tco_0276149 [Tanacetum coccineum]